MNCPICLENLNESLVFSCSHACCRLCYVASGITACPLCRDKITKTTPSPWLDCYQLQEQFQDFYDQDNRQSKRQIVDPRGYQLVETAAEIRSRNTILRINGLEITLVSL